MRKKLRFISNTFNLLFPNLVGVTYVGSHRLKPAVRGRKHILFDAASMDRSAKFPSVGEGMTTWPGVYPSVCVWGGGAGGGGVL